MISSSAAVGLTALILVYALFKRSTRPSLSMIRGPQSPSFIFGNNVLDRLSRGALDAMCHAAFDVQLNTIQDDSHPLGRKYRNYFRDLFALPSAEQIFMQAALRYIPEGIIMWLIENGPGSRLARMRDVTNVVSDLGKEMVQERATALLESKGDTGIFTLLIKANMDANAKKRLSDEELLAQIHTLLLAGQESIGTTTSFILLELARNPKIQSMLRDEIRRTEATTRERGSPHLTATDLEAMPYLNAVLKEGLRFHPIGTTSLRMAMDDDILPLSKPILGVSGDMIHEVRVSKGTEIMISISAYNRDKDLWGEDAHEFKPDRWLDGTMDGKESPGVGVYANLMSFYSGPQACIGWRFALIELQAFLSTLVGKFEFAMTDKAERIVRMPMFVMGSMVEGEFDRGVQMPLAVSLTSQNSEL
ncbi:cytochrome P450 [Boletus edulis]|nr:cytochrome P450 [Boletus edulis]